MQSSRQRQSALAGALALTLAAACSGEVEDPVDAFSCAFETRGDEYVDGLEKTGSAGLAITLVGSDPAPPVRGENTWTLAVADAEAMPLAGAVVDVVATMPDFDLRSPVPDRVTESGGGVYEAGPIVLFKPGLWEVRVSADDGSGVLDAVAFQFCVD